MKTKFGLLSLLSQLGKDEDASILVQATFYLVVVFGMVGLALDGGRFLLLHNSLQDLTDSAALAGARQLDGAQDAQTRATAAAQAIANDNPPHSWYYDIAGSTTVTTTFYRSLNPDRVAAGPSDSNYIGVTTSTTQPWGVVPTFVSAVKVLTGTTVANNTTVGAAIAQGFGNNNGVCAPIQSFMCNPWEGTETNPGNANNFSSHASVGNMMHLVNGANAPGNWGLLDPPPPLSTNPHDQTPFWGEASPGNTCTTGPSQGTTRTGNVAKFAQAGMNARFDSPAASGDQSLSAPIVIDGFTTGGSGNNCQRFGKGYPETCSGPSCLITGNGSPAYPPGFDPTNYSATCNAGTSAASSCPLPRDRTFTDIATGNAAWSDLLMGSGPTPADLQAYWKNHHSGSLPAGITTRFQIYQAEVPVSQGGLGTAPFTAASEAAEPSAPQCNKSTVGDINRRIINVAVVDCNYWSINGHSDPIPSATMVAQFFMTEPALDDGSIFGEYIGCASTNNTLTGCGGSGTGVPPLRPLVQLVR